MFEKVERLPVPIKMCSLQVQKCKCLLFKAFNNVFGMTHGHTSLHL